MKSVKLVEVKSNEEFIASAIKSFREVLEENEQAKIALSGGSTPKGVYQAIGQDLLSEFPRMVCFLVDERYIDLESDKSNFRLIKESVFSEKNLAEFQFHFFNTRLPIPEALDEYQKSLPEKLDLCLLGVGPDGHFGSLFPNLSELDSSANLVHTTTEVFEVFDRLSLGLNPIMNSSRIVVLMKGESKRATLEKMLSANGDWHDFPAWKLLEHPNLEIIFGDF